MPRERSRLKRAIGGLYSFAADTVYDRWVVRGAFPLLGGNINQLVQAQGRRAVRHAHGKPILDMPVGTGVFTLDVAQAHPGIVVGTDIAEGMVRHTAAAARTRGLANLATVRADAHHLPFRDGTFAAVLCTNGIQVMPGLNTIVSELARVLEAGGELELSTITLPVGAALSPGTAGRLPAGLMSRRELEAALLGCGLEPRETQRSRLGLLITAVKPRADAGGAAG